MTLALPVPVVTTDDEPDTLSPKVKALRRLHPVKARLLELIADEMIREGVNREAAKDNGA